MKKIVCFMSMIFVLMASMGFSGSLLDGWIKYDSEQGKYSVLLPQKPQPINDNLHGTMADVEYFTTYIQWFDVPGFSLERGRTGYVDGLKGTLLQERKISMSGYSGYEWTVQTWADNMDYIYVARTFQVGDRTYLVQFFAPKNNFQNQVIKDCEMKYFDSFVVKTK